MHCCMSLCPITFSISYTFSISLSFQQIESHPQWDQLEEETQGDEENSDVSDFTTDDEDSND